MAKVKDKATAFKNELSGSTTNKIVCKASSHEVAGPKKKHVDYLLQLSSSPNCQMTALADLVADRLRHNNWVVVFKALIVSHNLMSLGNERYMQCVATKQHMFNLDNFNDKSDFLASDMSVHVRKYARYLGCYAAGYKVMALDVCRVAKGEESPFRTMETGKVLKAAAAIQKQLDCLLEVEVTSSELTNGVINTSFLMLYKDLIKLYTAYNDILINLLDKFFESKKAQCKETIDAYRKFLTRQEGVQRYLQLAEEVGVDKQTHKDLRKVPDDLLPALEEHLSEMDSIRKANASQPSPVIKAASEKLSALSGVEPKKPKGLSKKASSGSGVASGLPSASDEILEAQKKRFEELKRQASLIKSSPDKASLSSQESETPKKSSSNDLLGLEGAFSSQPQQQPAAVPQPQTSNTETFNPWGSSAATSSVGNGIPPTQPVTTAVSNNPFQPQATATNASGGGGDPWGAQAQGQSSGYQEVDLFSEIRGVNFDNVFGSTEQKQPSSSVASPFANSTPQMSAAAPPLMGGILQPQAVGPLASQAPQLQPQRLTQDVESSLVRAAENLSMSTTTSNNLFFSPATTATSTSTVWPSGQQTQVVAGSVITGSSPWTTTDTSNLQQGPGRLVTKNPLDDIVLPESLFAGIEMNTKTGLPKKADHQWGPSKEAVKTGGPNYLKQQLQPRSLHPGSHGGGTAVDWSKGSYSGHFPNQPVMQQAPPMMMQPGMIQPTMMQPTMMQPGMVPPGMMQPGMMQPTMMMPQQQFMQQPQPGMWSQQPPRQQPADPFASLAQQQASLF